MAEEQPADKVLQGHYVYLKDNLITHKALIDELLACGALTDEEKVDYKKIHSIKSGALIKRIIGKGPATCRDAISILQNPEYGIYEALQQRNQAVDRENCSFSCNTIKDHRPYFLDELEPSKTADYLFQYDVFSKDIHDEIEAIKDNRFHKTQCVLHHLEKYPHQMHIFVHVLQISNQGYIIEEVLKEGNEQLLTPQEECVNCVRVNFRKIRRNLHFEITSSYLWQEGVIDCQPTTEDNIHRGKLVKDAIRRGSHGCESLLKCLKMQLEELFKQVLDEWNKKKNLDPRKNIDITLQGEDLGRFEKVFISDLQPLELSDILLEFDVISVTNHDNIESTPSRRRRVEVLLSCLKSVPEKLDYFVYALKECREESVLEKIRNREFGEEPVAAIASTSRLELVVDQGVPQVMPEGVLQERLGLTMILKENDNPDSPIKKIVTVVNRDPNVNIQVVKRSQDPFDIMRRKIQENEALLVDELEPSQLTSFLVHKNKKFVELEREIEQQKGRRQRGKKLLEKIRTSADSTILESFKEFMDSIGRQDLIELVQFSPKDKEDHEKAENIRNILIPNYTNVVEEIETSIIKETLQKFVKIHNIKEEYKSFLPETGKSRQDRVHRFLTFVFQKDEYVIELEKVFRQNNLDHLLEKKQEDYFGLEEPSKKRKLSLPSTLKEGELFDCTYKVVLSKGPGPKKSEEMEVDYPQAAKRLLSQSFDAPKGYPSGSSDGEKKLEYTHELEISASSATTSESTTDRHWGFPDSSPTKQLFDSKISALNQKPSTLPLSKCLLTAMLYEKRVEKIRSLSTRLEICSDMPENTEELETGTIYVYDVDVVCHKDKLVVNGKDHPNRKHFFSSDLVNTTRVIQVHSRSVRVIEAKLQVYREFETVVGSENIVINHEFDDDVQIRQLSAVQRLTALYESVISLKDSISNVSIEVETTLKRAASETLSRESINALCITMGFRQDDPDEAVGIENEMIRKFLKVILESFGWKTIEYIISNIQRNLKLDKSYLQLDISGDNLSPVASIIISFIDSIFSFIENAMSSMDITTKEWRGNFANKIHEFISQKTELILHEATVRLRDMFQKTIVELETISKDINNLKNSIDLLDQKELIKQWEQREVIKDRKALSKFKSILTYVAGNKDNVPFVKVFLRHDDKEAKEFFHENCRFSSDAIEFVNVADKRKEKSSNLKQCRNAGKTKPMTEDDIAKKKKLVEIIRKHEDRLLSNHSILNGIGLSRGVGDPSIVLYCLDKTLVPFGERMLPKYIEGYPVDIREELYMFGSCENCRCLNYGCSIGRRHYNSAGSLGFFVKNPSSLSDGGFLTAAHVALNNEFCTELYDRTTMLSQTLFPFQEIVHPSYRDNKSDNVIGQVIEAFCGNYECVGIDVAYIKLSSQKRGEKPGLKFAEDKDFQLETTRVTKTGRTTGYTTGLLVEDSRTVSIDNIMIAGVFARFAGCYIVEDLEEIFFEGGDSGSGVFLEENKENEKKALGIAFANTMNGTQTAVCNVQKVVKKLELELYHEEISMDL